MPKTIPSDSHNLRRLNPKAAAIDIGATMHMAAVNPDVDDIPIRAFGTFTHDYSAAIRMRHARQSG